MDKITRVALDAMGGDNAPAEVVKGAVEAIKINDSIRVSLVGKEDAIKAELSKYTYPEDRITVVNATEVIETSEHPVAAIRKKKDSSIVVGMKLVRDGEVDGFVSAGNSGAILVGGQTIVGRVRGVDRAPLAAIIPTAKGICLLLDCGANVDAKAHQLVQFARMGSVYMQDVIGIKNPKVGIINIGAEEEKGNALVKETFPLLKELKDINFVGSCEARDITVGDCDVVVAEAFAGNIALKMMEGVAKTLLSAVKKGLMSNLRSKIGALLIKPALRGTLKTFDATEYGGAPMLGLKALVVKTHGNAKAKEVKNSILQCVKFNEAGIPEKMTKIFAAQDDKPVADQ